MKTEADTIIDLSLETNLKTQLREFRTNLEFARNYGFDPEIYAAGQKAARDFAKAIARVMIERGNIKDARKIVRRQVAYAIADSKREK